MCEEKQTTLERKLIFMWPSQVDEYIIADRTRSHRRKKEENMSRKEKKEGVKSILDLVKRYEGEWNVNKIVAEIALEQGLKRETVEGYVTELIIAHWIERRGEHLYTVEESEPARGFKEEPKE